MKRDARRRDTVHHSSATHHTSPQVAYYSKSLTGKVSARYPYITPVAVQARLKASASDHLHHLHRRKVLHARSHTLLPETPTLLSSLVHDMEMQGRCAMRHAPSYRNLQLPWVLHALYSGTLKPTDLPSELGVPSLAEQRQTSAMMMIDEAQSLALVEKRRQEPGRPWSIRGR